jgi:hypothetical protein
MENSEQSNITNNSVIKSESEQKRLDEISTFEIDEAIKTINYFNKEHSKESLKKKESGNGLICTTISDIDWISNIFMNKDLKNMLIQNNHIREILIDQALYYFIIFSKIFNIWYKEKETEKLVKEEEKEREKQIQKYHVNLPPIDMKKILKKIVIPGIKVGVVGAGNIGKKLLENLIKIKDKNIYNFKIYVSTRQPDKIINEYLDLLDDNIQIFLNNEKIFEECDVIFLCIQPTQLDLLSKEIFQIFSERIEKLTKREYKCYPLIISFLSATTVQRLEMFFPKKVNIIRSRLLYNFLRTKKKPLFSGNNTIDENGEYIEESCDHLLEKDKSTEVIENLIIGLTKQFYMETIIQHKKGNVHEYSKNIEKCVEKSPLLLFEIIFGEDLAYKYHEIFNFIKGKFIIDEEQKKEKEKENNDLVNNEFEENPEEIKKKQEFSKNIGNDFKNQYISYLEKLLK